MKMFTEWLNEAAKYSDELLKDLWAELERESPQVQMGVLQDYEKQAPGIVQAINDYEKRTRISRMSSEADRELRRLNVGDEQSVEYVIRLFQNLSKELLKDGRKEDAAKAAKQAMELGWNLQ